MNEQNYDYLKNQLKYTGFGEALQSKLKEAIELGQPNFMLYHTQNYGKENIVATLHFNKSDNTDMYFFNRYSILVNNNLHPDAAKQTFYLNKDEDTVTLKEAFNLMSGRAVFKELTNKEKEKYNAWIQLDFKHTNSNDNFDMKKFNENYFKLEEVLAKYPIKEMLLPEEQDKIMKSLQRGNVQAVNIGAGEKTQVYMIEVQPQFKTLNFYDTNMKRVMRENVELKAPAEKTTGQEVKKEAKQTAGAGDDEGPAAGQAKKRKKVSVS